MAFDIKKDWPIVAAVLLLILGFIAVSSAGSSSGSSAPTGPTSAELGVTENQDNIAAQLAETQSTNQAAITTAQEQGVFGIIGDLISNQGQLQQSSVSSQEAEYEAYLQELGTAFGDSTNLLTSQGTDAVQLAALKEELQQAQGANATQELLELEMLGGSALGVGGTI